ncbi:MAG TPA: hypothetical protein VEN78_42725 [Bradyrhizobium sp.]|nr:hypothetical protein [Bradyrhizobium sp.]
MTEIKFGDVKELAGSFAAFAGLAYAAGYLILRARARALGTDPALGLVEEVYVFAGFRFFLTLFIALIVTLPFIAAARAGALWVARMLPAPGVEIARWSALIVVAIVVILEFRVFEVSNVLLDPQTGTPNAESNALLDGVLGRNSLGLWLVLGTTGLAALLLLWVVESGARVGANGFSFALTLVVLLQLLMLPVYHGVFFADRSVRVPEGVPASANGLVAPIAIVDRAGDRVTLFGVNKSGERRLVMIDESDLKGTGIRSVTTLRAFLETLAKTTTSDATK